MNRTARCVFAVAGGVLVLATAGWIGYAMHSSPGGGSRSVATPAARESTSTSTSLVPSTSTSVASSSTTVPLPTPAPAPEVRVVSVPATTTPPPTVPLADLPHYPWPAKPLAQADVAATLSFSTDTFVAGLPVNATVTLVNRTDAGVILRPDLEVDVAIVGDNEPLFLCDPKLYFGDWPAPQGVLPPRATVSATCRWVPGDPGPDTVTVGLQQEMLPDESAFTTTPVAIVVEP